MTFGVPPFFRGASYGLGELAVEIGSVAESYRLCDEIDRIVLVFQQQFFGLLYPQIGAPAAEIHAEPVGEIHVQRLLGRAQLFCRFFAALVIFPETFFLYPFIYGALQGCETVVAFRALPA